MIQAIINNGKYEFSGNLDDLKRCLSSFKVTKVICMEEIQGIKICEVLGKFRYHGANHKVHISKYWGDKELLFIEYRGVENVQHSNKNKI